MRFNAYSTCFNINGFIAFFEDADLEGFIEEFNSLCEKYMVYSDITKTIVGVKKESMQYNQDLDITNLDMSVPLRNGLLYSNIHNLEELKVKRYLKDRFQYDLRRIGEKLAKELVDVCEKYGVELESECELDYSDGFGLSHGEIREIYVRGFDTTEQIRNTNAKTLFVLFNRTLYEKIIRNIKKQNT